MKKFINALLPTSSNAFKRVELLFDEKIIKISADEIACEESCDIIDLNGALLLPGAVDAHSHILSDKDSEAKLIARYSQEAIKGGWTTIAEMSFRSKKPIFTLDDMQHFAALVEEHSYIDMALWGNVNINDYPYHAEAAQILWAKGVVGIALFSPSPNPALQEMSFSEIMDLFMDIYESDTAFSFQGFDTESDNQYTFESQREAIKKLLRRMQENPIHIPRVSAFETVEFINSISKRSDISFSLAMADMMELFDNTENPAGYETDLKGYSAELYELLRTNKIYMITNNSTDSSDKYGELYRGLPPGLLRHSYTWILSELWKSRKIPLANCLRMISENPAKRLGIYPQKGCLEAGSDADFVIFDPQGSTEFKLPDGSTKQLTGTIKSVYLRGTEVFNGKKIAKPNGSFVVRTNNPKRRHNKTTWI